MISGLFIRAFQVHRIILKHKTIYPTVISTAIEMKAGGNVATSFIKKFIELLISTAGYKRRKPYLEINIKSLSPATYRREQS